MAFTKIEDKDEFLKTSFNSIIIGICYSRGIFIPLLRFIEPIYRQRLVDKLKYFAKLGCVRFKRSSANSIYKDKTLKHEMADPNIDFLSSNQNNLMVTGLLEGINTALENVDGKSFRQKLDIKRITI